MSDTKNKLINCSIGNHEFVEIYSIEFEDEETEKIIVETVNWCSVCGAISVDMYKDGTSFPGEVLELVSPEIINEIQLFMT